MKVTEFYIRLTIEILSLGNQFSHLSIGKLRPVVTQLGKDCLKNDLVSQGEGRLTKDMKSSEIFVPIVISLVLIEFQKSY